MSHNPIRWIIKTIKEPSPKKDVLFAFVMALVIGMLVISGLIILFYKLTTHGS